MAIKPWVIHLGYLFSGVLSLAIGFVVASFLMSPSHSQTEEAPAQNEQPVPSSVVDVPPPPATATPDAVAPIPSGEVSGAPESTNVVPPSAQTSELLPESVSLLEPYVFDTREGRRNPFRAPVMTVGGAAPTDSVVGPGTPLERYELDQIKLAAILWDVKNPKAMFIDPGGEVHILTKDDRIGRRRGYVATIRESEVVVVELTSFSGEQQYSTRILRIDQ